MSTESDDVGEVEAEVAPRAEAQEPVGAADSDVLAQEFMRIAREELEPAVFGSIRSRAVANVGEAAARAPGVTPRPSDGTPTWRESSGQSGDGRGQEPATSEAGGPRPDRHGDSGDGSRGPYRGPRRKPWQRHGQGQQRPHGHPHQGGAHPSDSGQQPEPGNSYGPARRHGHGRPEGYGYPQSTGYPEGGQGGYPQQGYRHPRRDGRPQRHGPSQGYPGGPSQVYGQPQGGYGGHPHGGRPRHGAGPQQQGYAHPMGHGQVSAYSRSRIYGEEMGPPAPMHGPRGPRQGFRPPQQGGPRPPYRQRRHHPQGGGGPYRQGGHGDPGQYRDAT